MRRPSDYPKNVNWGEVPDDAAVRAIYKKLGLRGHNGQDYAPPTGGKTYAITRGSVKIAGWREGGYGYCVIYVMAWTDGKQYEVAHCHLSRVDVKVGDTVTEGQVVGLTGASGDVTGPHLHFAIRRMGVNQNDGYYGYEDPERFFTTSAPGPRKDDMTWNDFVRTMYRLFRPGDVLTDEIVTNHAGNLARLESTGVDTWVRNFIASGDQYLTQHDAITAYWRAKGGADPDSYADERLGGGSRLAEVLNGDLPADKQELQLALDQKAATDAALNSANDLLRAKEDEIRELHIALEKTEQMPEFALEPSKLRLLGNYLVRLAKQKGGGNS